jgi:hypothetical protein
MNKSLTVFAGALLSVSSLIAASSAQADDKKQYGASSINVALSGAAPELTVRNVANSNKLSDVQLAIQQANLSIGVGGYVDCTGTQIENFTYREGHFLSAGKFGIGRTSLIVSKALPNSSDINHVSDLDAHTFNLSFAQLAGGQIGVNPTALHHGGGKFSAEQGDLSAAESHHQRKRADPLGGGLRQIHPE